MNVAERSRGAVVAFGLLALVCSSCKDSDDGAAEPLVMTITSPTSGATFATTDSELVVGGTITGIQPLDFLPGGVARVENGATGRFYALDLGDNGTWRTRDPVGLLPGTNPIHAYVDVASGFSEDFLTITSNP
jgi:hypothetical protein